MKEIQREKKILDDYENKDDNANDIDDDMMVLQVLSLSKQEHVLEGDLNDDDNKKTGKMAKVIEIVI